MQKTLRSVASESLIKLNKEGQLELCFPFVIQQILKTSKSFSSSKIYDGIKS